MKLHYLIIQLSIACILFQSCETSKSTKVSGTIKNGNDMSVFIDKVGLTSISNNRIASTKTNGDGTFEFKIPNAITKGVYRVTLGAKALEFLSDGTEKHIVIKGDLNTIDRLDYTVEGSKLSAQFVDIAKQAVSGQMDAQKLQAYASSQGDPLIGFMIGTRFFGFNPSSIELHEKVLSRLQTTDYDFITDYSQMVDGMKQEIARKEAAEKIKVGMDAPDIALPGIDGNIKKLSAYKGKVVLIDFWASWCGPCRKANPQVVSIYQKYKEKGFDVYSVSLDGVSDRKKEAMKADPSALKSNIDKSKTRWMDAIAQDKLEWKGHVSDLKEWSSAAAALYGVSSIPKTFLMGRDGKIVAVDPRFNLEQELLKVL